LAGCFSAFYSVRGAGGIQMFGVHNRCDFRFPTGKQSYLSDFIGFFSTWATS